MEKNQNFISNLIKRVNERSAKKQFIKNPNIENWLKLPVDERGVYIRDLPNEATRVKAIMNLQPDRRKSYIYIIQMSEENKLKVIMSLPENERGAYVSDLPNESKLKVIMSLPENERGVYISELPDENKTHVIRSLPENLRFSYILQEVEDRKQQLELIKEIPEKADILERMRERNSSIDENIELGLLDEKYIHYLGIDKVNQLSCHSGVQKRILDLSDKEFKIMSICIDDFMSKGETEEWTNIADNILAYISEYPELIESIEDVEQLDIDTLTKVLQDKNVFGLKNVSEISIDNYEEIKAQKTNEMIKSDRIHVKKEAVFEKIFGHSSSYARDILRKFGKDIDSLPDSEMKEYIKSLREISSCDDAELLDKLYRESQETTFIDKQLTERSLKTEYGKLFNEGLLTLQDGKEMSELGEGVYSAGTDFRMIVTSIGFSFDDNVGNYKNDWNRPSIESQHICTSYIRNDMLAVATSNSIFYGFNDMAEDSLMLSGPYDIGSTMGAKKEELSLSSIDEEYHTPDEQINCNQGMHNEMDFRRVQKGEKKQPSYIVVFKKNGQIENMEKAQKAQLDWGKDESGHFKMPIVVVDVDECIKSESDKLDILLEEYDKNPSKERAKEIYHKVRNNRVTTGRWREELFRKDIELDKYNEDEGLEQVKPEEPVKTSVTKQDLVANYSKVSAKERRKGVEVFKRILEQIQEIKRGVVENGER